MSRRAGILIGMFGVALAVRLATLAMLLPELRPDVDRDCYRELARNLNAGKGYVARSDTGRELPNLGQPPLYPLFLAGLMRLGGDRLWVFLAVQCVLGAVVCVLTVWLAARWLPWGAAAVAGVLVAIDPNSVLRCSDLSTEMVFTPLLLGGACALAWATQRSWAWWLAGLLWAAGALCRPIAQWLPVVAVAVVVIDRRRWRLLAILLAGFLPLPAIWAARNAALTGHWFISTVATSNLFFYQVAGVEAAKHGVDFDTMQRRLRREYGDVQFFEGRAQFDENRRKLTRAALRSLCSAPLVAATQTAQGWARVVVGPGLRGLNNILPGRSPTARWWPFYSLALGVVAVLSIGGAVRLGRSAALVWAMALYFFLLSGGPSGSSRFRVPITPLLAILAVAAVPSARNRTVAGS